VRVIAPQAKDRRRHYLPCVSEQSSWREAIKQTLTIQCFEDARR
jgi:hypothetical protein